MCIGQIDWTEIWFGQTEQTKKVFRPDLTDKNMVFDQTEQTKIWVFARQNRLKNGYRADRTDLNMGIGQTE